MATIINITGKITAFDTALKSPLAAERLVSLHGVKYDKDLCSNYLDGELAEIGLTGGALQLVYPGNDPSLRVLTTYVSPRKLTRQEVDDLIEETRGQWSDGIGEGCFDECGEALGVMIDLFPLGIDQDIQVSQVEDGLSDDPKIAATRSFLKAVKKGNLKAVEKSLDDGADIEAKQSGFPALHVAIGESQLEMVRLLLERGADANSDNITGGPPLATCALNRKVSDAASVAMAELLIRHGADVNRATREFTPLDYALNRERILLQELLKSRGGISVYYAKKS